MKPLLYDFTRYAKKVTVRKGQATEESEDWTQLQFIFEKVEKSEFFPNGVKMTYRAYCNDEVYEIVEDKTTNIGLSYKKYRILT
jgi:hypothetical protein